MSNETQQSDMTRKTVVLEIPGMDAVTVRRDVAFRDNEAGALTMDVYTPADPQAGARRPAVVFVSGYPDPGFEAFLGCKLKDMGSYTSWGRLVAASGMVGVTYTNREPAADLEALLAYLRQNAASLGIDENRIGLWAASGNVPMALSALMQEASGSLACAVLAYGFLLDLGGAHRVATAAAQVGFVNPSAGKSVADLPRDLPLFLVRAGKDEIPGINETMGAFLAEALAHNLPVTFVNHATAPHAFDVLDDSDTSREVIRSILAFLRFHLRA